jgi:signal-transduction protein with cAMP-binding, CBS, and nucleotidyltransferase domain
MPITLKVRDVEHKKVTSIDEKASVCEAAEKMASEGRKCLLVTRDSLPVGIITEGSILRKVVARKLNPDKVKVSEVMSSPLITIEEDASLYEATRLMLEKNIKQVYVTKDGEVVGLVTQQDLIQGIMNSFLSILSV